MADWWLLFRSSRSHRIEAIATCVAAAIEAPVQTHEGTLDGNPRDGYYAAGSIIGEGLHVHATLSAWSSAEHATVDDVRVSLSATGFAAKLATWQRLRAGLAPLGYRDATLADRPARIVLDAEAAGEAATAARLRAEIREALVLEYTPSSWVRLVDTRVDDAEALLAAIGEPERKDDLEISACGLVAVPAAIARFPNLAKLTFADAAPDLGGLRGASLPRLAKLVLASSGIRRIDRADLAGMPWLVELDLTGSKIQELDPDIIDACPRLQRVGLSQTALGFESRKAPLRERWRGVTLE